MLLLEKTEKIKFKKIKAPEIIIELSELEKKEALKKLRLIKKKFAKYRNLLVILTVTYMGLYLAWRFASDFVFKTLKEWGAKQGDNSLYFGAKNSAMVIFILVMQGLVMCGDG